MNKITYFSSEHELQKVAAQEFCMLAREAFKRSQRFVVALSGGTSPIGLFKELAERGLSNDEWSKVYIFWSDERYVDHESPLSNYRQAYDTLLNKVPVPKANIFVMPTEHEEPEYAAHLYEMSIRDFFVCAPDEIPEFDLVYLGLGTDGHTASLFPGTPIVQACSTKQENPTQLVCAHQVAQAGQWRLSMTPAIINNSREVHFLITGKAKEAVLDKVLTGPYQPELLPVQFITNNHKNIRFFVNFN